ncbi:hypothetical protein K435DRAFT_856389 [Dendrothele bispora CBS 962.96]|uniref:DUF6589 domain-containing protein n=1 Tax=Dendrothele bispora (strain CBS 962.96) TaxID=1314807 RepID=A0A4S8M9C7_DENBC|nr:hypothetical protein K435DRAFT_856389 [Dendrothele bispora CBS 962.96]
MQLKRFFKASKSSDISLSYLRDWDVSTILKSVSTPVFSRVLRAASIDAKKDVKAHKLELSTTRCNIITAQVHYTRSRLSSKLQSALGIYAWANGTSEQMMDVLYRCGIIPSTDTVFRTILELGDHALNEAVEVVRCKPCSMTYDNFHITQSTFVEQRPGAPQKVQTGTFPVAYELYNADFRDMKLTPIRENFLKSPGLTLVDIIPSEEQSEAYYRQSIIHIIRVLTKHVPEFSTRYDLNHPLLQHHPCRPLPSDHQTKFFPLRMCLTEEASVIGNIRVQEDVYINQLGFSPDELSEYAWPFFADLLTVVRSMAIQCHRWVEATPWDRREIFQFGPGLFHVCLNLVWAILHTHRGDPSQPGTLCFFFSLLEKKRLGGEKPDYHTLLSALQQILDGIILAAWEQECGYRLYLSFLRYQPPPPSPASEKNDKHHDHGDIIFQNTCKIFRDLLYVRELVQAISDCDFGCVEDILPDLARIFRGAGSNNYSTQLLHFLHNIKKVWPLNFANIMRDNMIINVAGLPGHGMGIDMNIEHLIDTLKGLLAAKGVYLDWYRYRQITAAIKYLEALKKIVRTSMGTAYQKVGHTDPDTSLLGQRIFEAVFGVNSYVLLAAEFVDFDRFLLGLPVLTLLLSLPDIWVSVYFFSNINLKGTVVNEGFAIVKVKVNELANLLMLIPKFVKASAHPSRDSAFEVDANRYGTMALPPETPFFSSSS